MTPTHNRTFSLALSTLLIATSTCSTAVPQADPRITAPPATATAAITLTPALMATETVTPISCLSTGADIMRSAQINAYSPETNASADARERTDALTLVTYQVSGDQIRDPYFEAIPDGLEEIQKDITSQQEAWQLFTAIISPEDRRMVAIYMAFTDGPGKTLAAVQQTETDARKWVMELDIQDMSNTHEMVFTILHEYGHLLTLNASQVPPDLAYFKNPDNEKLHDQSVANCPTYYASRGCSKPDSYVHNFYERFWVNLVNEWEQVRKPLSAESRPEYNQRQFAFYQKYADQFVDDYAITSPLEDIAESFAFFILTPSPDGDLIRDQKMRFFSDYPELVQLRSRILANLCSIKP